MTKELKKILYIDDDQDIHMIVDLCLREIPNVELKSAYSGEEGIRMAMDFRPDLILLDVMMPKMDGIATLQSLKLQPSFANTPVVFLTAKAQKNEIENYFKYGICDVIIKPFDPMTLGETVQKIWENYQKLPH